MKGGKKRLPEGWKNIRKERGKEGRKKGGRDDEKKNTSISSNAIF